MSMAIVPDCRGLYSTWEDVQREQPATPDPLLAIVRREAARIEHPAVRSASALRTGGGVVLTLIYQYGVSRDGLNVSALIDRMGGCIERGMPDYDPPQARCPYIGTDGDTWLLDGTFRYVPTWLSIIWVGGN